MQAHAPLSQPEDMSPNEDTGGLLKNERACCGAQTPVMVVTLLSPGRKTSPRATSIAEFNSLKEHSSAGTKDAITPVMLHPGRRQPKWKAGVVVIAMGGLLGGCNSELGNATAPPSTTRNCLADSATGDCRKGLEPGPGVESNEPDSPNNELPKNELPASGSRPSGRTPTTSISPDTHLYAFYCADCHDPLPNSKKLGRSANDIRSALTRGLMAETPALQSLTDQQIETIAEELVIPVAPMPIDPPERLSNSTSATLIANRHVLSSKMRLLFAGTLESEQDRNIDNIIRQHILDRAPVFGGPCSREEETCPAEDGRTVHARGIPRASPLRNGYRIRTCEDVLSEDRSINNLVDHVGLEVSSPRSKDNLGKVFVAMTSHPLDDAIYQSFRDIDNTVSGDTDAWRYIAFAICISSAFETI